MKNERWVRIYQTIAIIFTVGVALQVFLAGLAVFMDPSHWNHHVQFARLIFFLPIVMVIVALVARLGKSYVLRSLGLLGMIFVLFFTAGIASTVNFIGALHPVIAILLFWLGLRAVKSA